MDRSLIVACAVQSLTQPRVENIIRKLNKILTNEPYSFDFRFCVNLIFFPQLWNKQKENDSTIINILWYIGRGDG